MRACEVMDCLHLPRVTSADIPTSDYAVRSRAFLEILPARSSLAGLRMMEIWRLKKFGRALGIFTFRKRHI